jgi:hypothetical protein
VAKKPGRMMASANLPFRPVERHKESLKQDMTSTGVGKVEIALKLGSTNSQ